MGILVTSLKVAITTELLLNQKEIQKKMVANMCQKETYIQNYLKFSVQLHNTFKYFTSSVGSLLVFCFNPQSRSNKKVVLYQQRKYRIQKKRSKIFENTDMYKLIFFSYGVIPFLYLAIIRSIINLFNIISLFKNIFF